MARKKLTETRSLEYMFNLFEDRISTKQFIEDVDRYIKQSRPDVKVKFMLDFIKLKMQFEKHKKDMEDTKPDDIREMFNQLLDTAKKQMGETPIK